jgi:hypothetical protein
MIGGVLNKFNDKKKLASDLKEFVEIYNNCIQKNEKYEFSFDKFPEIWDTIYNIYRFIGITDNDNIYLDKAENIFIDLQKHAYQKLFEGYTFPNPITNS